MNVTVLLLILELAAKYGVPAVREIIEAWEKTSVTEEDIEVLRGKLKHPNEYR